MKLKFKIHSPEHSEAIQKLLFEHHNATWISGNIISYTKSNHLYSDETILSHGSDEHWYQKQNHQETTLDDLYKMKTNPILKIDNLNNKIEQTADGYKIGCQSITFEDAEKIAKFFTDNKKEQK